MLCFIYQDRVTDLVGKGSQGTSYFTAKNPSFGAAFTYYLADEYNSLKKTRQEKEKALIKENKSVEFPGLEEVETERVQERSDYLVNY